MLFYTHVNEDNRVERAALMDFGASTVYAIGGSGERVIALLDAPSLSRVYVIDSFEPALFLNALKLVALQHLSLADYLPFIGVQEATGEARCAWYDTLAPELPEDCRLYWSDRLPAIRMGICNSGHFERFLSQARPWLHGFLGANFTQCMDTPRAQWQRFPHQRWALVRRLFSWRITYRCMGLKDPAFLASDADLPVIPAAMQQSLMEDGVSESCLFHLVINGHLQRMPADQWPPSFQLDLLRRARERLRSGQVIYQLVHGDIQSVLTQLPADAAEKSFYSLSDLLSFETWDGLVNLLQGIARQSAGQRRVLFRAFVRRRPTRVQLEALALALGPVQNLSQQERTHFYQVFQMDF